MPIYAYRCAACGHSKDVLQKLADAPLSVCPACGAAAFTKQVTAAGFQLKGSGWYATDFKNGGAKPAKPADAAAAPAADGKAAGPGKGDGAAATPAAPAPAASAAPATAAPPAAPAARPGQ